MAPKVDGTSIRARAEALLNAPAATRSLMAAPLREQVEQLAGQLGTQYDWLSDHPTHPKYREFEDKWLADLKHYEFACDALGSVSTNLRFVS